MKRTNFVLDEQLVEEAVRLSGERTYSRTVGRALEDAVAREALTSFPVVESPLSQGVFDEAVALYRSARPSGLAIRSSVDCLIAPRALRHDVTVLHQDRDFSALTRVSPLRERSVR